MSLGHKLWRIAKWIVGTWIVVLFICILQFAIEKYRESCIIHQKIMCASHLRGLSIGFSIYTEDSDGRLPTSSAWCDLIYDCVGDEEIYRCPIDQTGPCSYTINKNLPKIFKDLPDDMVVFFEGTPGWNQVGGPADAVTDRHRRPGCNVIFADRSYRFVKPEDIAKLRWRIE